MKTSSSTYRSRLCLSLFIKNQYAYVYFNVCLHTEPNHMFVCTATTAFSLLYYVYTGNCYVFSVLKELRIIISLLLHLYSTLLTMLMVAHELIHETNIKAMTTTAFKKKTQEEKYGKKEEEENCL